MKSIILLLLFMTAVSFAQQDSVIQGDITTNVVLAPPTTYKLLGYVRVQSGAVITIAPGTYIFGDLDSKATLVIKPGGKIMAEGTLLKPIVFTSAFAKTGASRLPNYGDWGGIILLGNARINPSGGTASIEGPGDQFGGTNDDDNSGIMKYVRIEYPGIALSLNNEINGLTMGGVGRGTVIEHIQVSYSGDDSYEWFGGNVNCKYLIAYRGWDDDFDTDFGFTGKLQYLVALRDPLIADQSQSNGFESDNDGSGSINTPLTSPTWFNVTMIGPKAMDTTTVNSLFRRGMHLRRNSQNKISNSIVMGWSLGIILDGNKTITSAQNNTMWFRNGIVSGYTSKPADTVNAGGATLNPASWFTGASNRSYAQNDGVMLTSPFNFTNPDFRPMAGSPALSGAEVPPVDGFFDPAGGTHVGAFGTTDWTAGWADWTPVNYVTDVNDNENLIESFILEQNYPNPFNPSTKISYNLPLSGGVKLSVFNSLGEEIAVLVNGYQNAGTHSVVFNASRLTSGVYLYRIETSGSSFSKKMLYLK